MEDFQPHESDSLNRGAIDYTKFTIKENSMDSIYKDVIEYLVELDLGVHVRTKRVNLKEIDPIVCNKLMEFLFNRYKDDPCVTKVDLFSLVLDVIDIPPTFFYNSLTGKYQDLLKTSLQSNMSCKINFDIDKKNMKDLGYTQVEI